MQIRRIFTRTMISLAFCLLTPWQGGANHAQEDIPIFTEAKVAVTVIHALDTGIYTYQYTLTNPPANTTEIDGFSMNISLSPSGLLLPTMGLTLDRGNRSDGTRHLVSFEDDVKDLIDLSAFVPAVPVGTMMPSVSDLWTSVSVIGKLLWSPHPRVPPGTSHGPLQVFSPGLPTIRSFQIEPDFYPTMEPGDCPEDQECGDNEESAEGDFLILNQLIIRGKTLGPTAPPADFNPLTFIETIRGYITESQTLGWLTDANLSSALNGHLNTAAEAIPTGDIATAKLAIEAFIAALPVPPLATAVCRSECSGLLVFNAQYLLDRLPKEPDLIVTNVTASANSVQSGGIFSVTTTIRNQGGGMANASFAHILFSPDTTIDLTDRFLSDFSVPVIGIGQTQTITTTPSIPNDISPGNYTLMACADITGIIAEIDETNNCKEGEQVTVNAPPPPTNDEISEATLITSFPFPDHYTINRHVQSENL